MNESNDRLPNRTILAEVDGFTPVIDALAAELGGITALVYGVVWRYCQLRDGTCWASQQTLAAKTGITVKTVRRHLTKLVDAGYLEDRTPGVRNRPHVYADRGRTPILRLVMGDPADGADKVGQDTDRDPVGQDADHEQVGKVTYQVGKVTDLPGEQVGKVTYEETKTDTREETKSSLSSASQSKSKSVVPSQEQEQGQDVLRDATGRHRPDHDGDRRPCPEHGTLSIFCEPGDGTGDSWWGHKMADGKWCKWDIVRGRRPNPDRGNSKPRAKAQTVGRDPDRYRRESCAKCFMVVGKDNICPDCGRCPTCCTCDIRPDVGPRVTISAAGADPLAYTPMGG